MDFCFRAKCCVVLPASTDLNSFQASFYLTTIHSNRGVVFQWKLLISQ